MKRLLLGLSMCAALLGVSSTSSADVRCYGYPYEHCVRYVHHPVYYGPGYYRPYYRPVYYGPYWHHRYWHRHYYGGPAIIIRP